MPDLAASIRLRRVASPPASNDAPPPSVARKKLRADAEVVIRAIRPHDEPLMVKFHGMLSDRTVYFRYFCSLSLTTRTAHERLARICFVDSEREAVLVADHTDPKTGEQSIVAVGRLNKLPDGKSAEIAVLVSDFYQSQGIGKKLLLRLIEIAREQKIARLVAEMLRDNIPMQVVLKRLGFRLSLLNDPRSVRAVLEL
jgi:acetyltransferase